MISCFGAGHNVRCSQLLGHMETTEAEMVNHSRQQVRLKMSTLLYTLQDIYQILDIPPTLSAPATSCRVRC